MNKKIKTAVIYARYSSENQSEQSIEGQLRVCQDYAKNNNIVILDTYIDRAMSGTNDHRPAFQKMIADSKKKEWDYVLVYKFDRFSRKKVEMLKHKETLKQNGVTLVSATEYLPDTPERILVESMIEGYAEYYSAELSQKVKRGMRETRLKGNFTGGNIIYGYKVENKKVIIDEDKAEVVRFIFNQYAVGVFVKDIIADLTARGILNRGKPFAPNTVYNILRNEKYLGIYRFEDQIFDNIYPQIVTTATFNLVKEKIKNNQYGKRSTTTVYLLRNKMKCGYCGSNITAESGTSKSGKVKRYYKCIGRKHRNGCKKSMLRKDFLEDFVVHATVSFLTDKANMDNMIKQLLKIQEELSKDNAVVNMLEREKRQCETSLENIMRAVEKGIINNTTGKRMRELEEQLDELNRKLLIEKDKASIKLTEKEIREFFVQALKLEPNLLVSYLVKEIHLFDDKIEIQFNSPINKSPDDSQGFLLYKGIKKMKQAVNKGCVTKVRPMITEIYV